MRKTILSLAMLILAITQISAQLVSKNLEECYGQVRADLVRETCCIVGYKNESVISKIENSSLKIFLDSLNGDNSQQKLYKSVKGSNKALSGTNISTYDTNIRQIRVQLQKNLIENYSDKSEVVIQRLNPFDKKIEQLTTECYAYNKSIAGDGGTSYKNQYPNGLFVSLLPTSGTPIGTNFNENTGQVNHGEAAQTAGQCVEDSNGLIESVDKYIGPIRVVIKRACVIFLLIILFICLFLICFKKRNRICAFIKRLFPKPGNGEPPTSVPVTPQPPTPGDSKLPEPPSTNPIDPCPEPQNAYNAFSEETSGWIIVGASVQGNGHISMGLPCQDSSGYKTLENGWGIAVTSDGAGSAKRSEIGSAIAVQRAIFHFENLIIKEDWIGKQSLPSEAEWVKLSYKVLKVIHDEIESFSKRKNVDFKDLSSTIIVVIHSPQGLLVCHIGDGRAGYQDANGEWHSMITPHKGEEANQTIFIPSDFWNIPFYEMSGVTVPESRVILGKIKAFTLMSDGCENTSWMCNLFNETTNKYYDPNLPHKPFFDSIVDTLLSFHKESIPSDERKRKWASFITNGNSSFVKESDDKTMIIGALYK